MLTTTLHRGQWMRQLQPHDVQVPCLATHQANCYVVAEGYRLGPGMPITEMPDKSGHPPSPLRAGRPNWQPAREANRRSA